MVFSTAVQDFRGVFFSQRHGSKQAGGETTAACHWEVADSALCTRGGYPVVQERKSLLRALVPTIRDALVPAE